MQRKPMIWFKIYSSSSNANARSSTVQKALPVPGLSRWLISEQLSAADALAARHFYKREDLQTHAAQVAGIPITEDDYSADSVFGRNGLEKMVAELSEHQRETLRLYFFEGYTLGEISEKIGQPLGNVRNHYYRALDKLRQQIFGPKVPGS